MATVKDVYRNHGKYGCVDFFRERLKSDLEYASNTYKGAIKHYNAIVKDGYDPMRLIPQTLLDEHSKAITEYENKVTEFMLALHDIPTRNFLGNAIMCAFFSFTGYMVPMDAENGMVICLFFWGVAALNLWSIIRRVAKIYGNAYFNKLEAMHLEIDKTYYHAVQVASNRIEQAITNSIYERGSRK